MNDRLPDVALHHTPAALAPLDWVGMQDIALPVLIEEEGAAGAGLIAARADLHVDLPSPHVKGIHMSRLYLLLDAWAGKVGVDGGDYPRYCTAWWPATPIAAPPARAWRCGSSCCAGAARW